MDSISALLPILSIWGGGPWVGLRSKTPVSSKGRVKKNVESVSMLIPPSDLPPPTSTVSALGYFFRNVFLDYWGCLVRGETDIVKFWVKFDQNNVKEGRPKFVITKVRGSMLMVK